MSLMIGVSGIRGVFGASLTPEIIVKYSSAFAEYCKGGKVVIGRDGRITGKIIGNLVASTLLSMGCDVIGVGIAPTPTIQIAVEQLHAAGGISITASHNPIQWNGLKFIGKSGMFLTAEENRRFWSIAEKNKPLYVPWDKLGKHQSDDSFLRQHIDMVMNLQYVNVDQIQKRKFKVVVDCINAAGGLILPHFLKTLGCDVIEMNCDVSGIFARTPEPVPENLAALCKRVRDEQAHLGIAVDPDVDRLVLINELGEPFGEEYTITTVVQFVLSHRNARKQNPPPTVVVNLSTTRAVDDVARQFGARVIRTPVGEINVARKMKQIGALVGGEGSGGVILPAVHYGRDAIVGTGLILQYLAELDCTLSELKSGLPQYAIAKSKVELTNRHPDELLDELKSRSTQNGNMNSEDGLKFDYEDSWVHLRKSNTEPIIRIISEAPTLPQAQELVQRYTKQILSL